MEGVRSWRVTLSSSRQKFPLFRVFVLSCFRDSPNFEDYHESTTGRKHETEHGGDRKGRGLRGSPFHPPVRDFRNPRFFVLSPFRVFVILRFLVLSLFRVFVIRCTGCGSYSAALVSAATFLYRQRQAEHVRAVFWARR